MAKQSKVLLVEGEADRLFFTACLRKAGLVDQVSVKPPNDFRAQGDGKGNAFYILPDLIEQLQDGTITQLALIIDADFSGSSGQGCQKTWEKIATTLNEYGYNAGKKLPSHNGGLLIKHNDGLPDFGLWIMPDNSTDGMLEDFIKVSIVKSESALFQHAQITVAKLVNPKFKSEHLSKAEVATWMAWQKVPGQYLAGAVGGDLLDFDTGPAKQFIQWLQQIYA